MSGMKIFTFEKGQPNRLRFEEAIEQLGEGKARTAGMRAMNHTMRKGLTRVRRVLVKQTSIPRGDVVAGTKFVKAGRASLECRIDATGRHLPLSKFNAGQFSYGVRAKVWGRMQRFKSAFIVPAYAGGVYHRVGPKRFPIEQLWGPNLAVELLKDESAHTFWGLAHQVHVRLNHEVARMLP